MRVLFVVVLLIVSCSAYSWGSCGTNFDRLKTTKLSVAGSIAGASKVTITASGNTDLHVPLESGAWQVRITEKGRGHPSSTDSGNLMKALKFDDPNNTTFTVAVSLYLPLKQASGEFDAIFFATDQANTNYMCLDIKYDYSSVMPNIYALVHGVAHCSSDAQCPSSYCQHPGPSGECHTCGGACCLTDKDCPDAYCANDPTKMPPYFCHGGNTALRNTTS